VQRSSAEQNTTKPAKLQTIPFRVFVEWAFIFLPIYFTADMEFTSGCAASRTFAISVGEELAIRVQRLHGLIAFAYMGWHVYTPCWLTHGMSTYAEMGAIANPWALAFMFVGVVASSFHLGVGIWNFFVQVGTGRHGTGQRVAGQLACIESSLSFVG